MVDTNEAYKPSQRWILLVGLGTLVWARLKTVYLTMILDLENNNSFPTLKSLPTAARLSVISQSKLLSIRQLCRSTLNTDIGMLVGGDLMQSAMTNLLKKVSAMTANMVGQIVANNDSSNCRKSCASIALLSPDSRLAIDKRKASTEDLVIVRRSGAAWRVCCDGIHGWWSI